ncbi:hypothetical protein P168DRAFT_250621 [Aspergillus campestris IBT 28561]|uniref:Prolyl 4-hydroxylase alpha subunit domain-containing protein n=1 Tax=Aspergillus campestris (strain IBT 28561) TaxID=1392248 RepID=A0A2I1D7A5_ASPC2|nr:uncharacterized protein P168DRAFT_250621 [Aspergillus campestris IBT 28561]PKY05755.1 hypothetical protein P168DRAFT_250621 [Aspergillus campestris IBT 28561]
MSSELPPDFLAPEAPPNATLRILDFEKTTPPIPAYKGHFAAVIDNLFTESECSEIIRLASESTKSASCPEGKWARAMVNAGRGKETMAIDTRNCGRILWDTPAIAEKLLARMWPFLEEGGITEVANRPVVTMLGPARRGEVFRLSGLNERLRVLRYEGGDYFRPHCDGKFVREDKSEQSFFTIQIYLSGDGVQDLEELGRRIEKAEKADGLFRGEDGMIDLSTVGEEVSGDEDGDDGEGDGRLLGGATSFTDGFGAKDAVRVFPKAGSVLVFQQRSLFHGGDDVFRGVKYTLRSDVMYKLVDK